MIHGLQRRSRDPDPIARGPRRWDNHAMGHITTKEHVGKDLDDMSTRISSLVRGTALGLVVVAWGLLITPHTEIHVAPAAILVVLALAFLALMLDWLQYLVGYFSSKRSWDDLEKDGDLRGYTPSWMYRARSALFGAKQAVAFLGVAILVVAMVPALIRLL